MRDLKLTAAIFSHLLSDQWRVHRWRRRRRTGLHFVYDYVHVHVFPGRAIGGRTYTQFTSAITSVVNLVLAAQAEARKDYTDNVIIDVANEAINPKKATDEGQKFLQLYKLGGTAGKSWTKLLQDLLAVPRDAKPSLRAFFSMKGVGDKDDKVPADGGKSPDQLVVEQAAKYYNSVYAIYAGKPQPPLMAPQFVRIPCPSAWADRVDERVTYMRKWNNQILDPFETYLQEENRRGSACCVNKKPCPSPDPLTPDMPAVTGCGGWPSGCSLPCDTGYDDFKDSAQNAKAKQVYAWIFHTYAGAGCGDPDKQIEKNMDPVEKLVAKDAKTWVR